MTRKNYSLITNGINLDLNLIIKGNPLAIIQSVKAIQIAINFKSK